MIPNFLTEKFSEYQLNTNCKTYFYTKFVVAAIRLPSYLKMYIGKLNEISE